MLRSQFLSIALFAAITASAASQSAVAQTNAQPTAQDVQQNQKMAQAALQVALLVDQHKVGEVWDGASPIAKQLVTRDAFVRQISADRQALGALLSRSVSGVTYRQSAGGQIPQGSYANVAFATRFANTKQSVRELISFHLDNDHVWRVSGYSLR
jgi:type II secretory pathway pseudopilin PulG